MKDLFGQALLDYQTQNAPENIITETSISEADEMEISYMFRKYNEMPKIEQKALQLAKGEILDVGCGAGSHTLYLQEKGFEVTAIDFSQKAIQTCQLRGVKKALAIELLSFNTGKKFDTILLLMNGTGIFGSIQQISKYLNHLKELLSDDGQILIDSSDLIYMYDQDEDGAYEVPANSYYGELSFTITYKKQNEDPFNWLYLDYNTLQNAAHVHGLNCELIMEGSHFDYLARITK